MSEQNLPHAMLADAVHETRIVLDNRKRFLSNEEKKVFTNHRTMN